MARLRFARARLSFRGAFLFGRLSAVWMAVGTAAVALLLYPSSVTRGVGLLTALALIGANYVSAKESR